MIKDLQYIFTCPVSPVQAEGLTNGNQFYFCASDGHWTFAVSEDPNVDPIDIQSSEQGKIYGYFSEARYGGKSFDAGEMPLEEAERIIENCVDSYLGEKGETGFNP